MKRFLNAVAVVLLLSYGANGVIAQKPKVVILGVDHTSQLINWNHQPAVLRTFIKRLSPAAICIERSPEEVSQNNYYEFTYEQQSVIIPLAKLVGIPIHPVDWIPETKDLMLAFGTADLEVPVYTRNRSGFWGFTVFTDSSSFVKDFYFADKEEYFAQNKKWYTEYPETVSFDFARRLFLYRTFMQAKRIQKVSANYNEHDTLLVVVGALHKNDIELNLASNGFEIVQPNRLGKITDIDIDEQFKTEDAYAILSFNLLGMQSRLDKINLRMVAYAFEKLKTIRTPEMIFLKTKYDLIQQKIDMSAAIQQYESLLALDGIARKFTWHGVKYKQRIDSYFDPFGNLSIEQRIKLELTQLYLQVAQTELYNQTKTGLINEFRGLKQKMFEAYLNEYIFKK